MAKQAEIPGISAVIAVASGKGGVGKSTTALNLALGLRDLGLRVGLLDADIYGPSVPRLTGIREKPKLDDDKKMIPITRFGLAIMSIGFLVEEETAMIWRGPMVMSAITQMLRDVAWGTLDVLVVDMPPGTGDAQLTLAQNVPLKGAVIISTPQDLSLIDARRGLAMFRKVNVPVLGIVENMSYFQCPHCGTRSDIFGHGGARHEAERLGVPFLGEIPLHMSIRSHLGFGNAGGGKRAGRSVCGDLSRDRRQGPRPAAGCYCRGLSRLRGVISDMRLSFNRCRHAFVAFSRPNFRVKARARAPRPMRRYRLAGRNAPANLGNAPPRRCLNEAS